MVKGLNVLAIFDLECSMFSFVVTGFYFEPRVFNCCALDHANRQ